MSSQLNEEEARGCTPHVCSIIPMHILLGIANSEEAEPAAREAANQALVHTRALRSNRVAHVARLRVPSTGGSSIVPPHILRAVAESETADSEARDAAQRTHDDSQTLRESRQAVFEATRTAATPAHLKRMVYTTGQTTRLPGTLVRGEGKPAATDKSINECYDGLGDTFDFYSKVFSRNSIDDKGLNLIGTVHYDRKWNNAMWNGSQMVFGDGDGIYFATGAFTGLIDVIGHELTHGVTQYTANLEYDGQSGALNESVSDVFGSMVKQYHLNQTVDQADWLIGKGIWSSKINGVALRSMSAPGTAYDDPKIGGKDPQPATMQDFVVTDEDTGGVHINSGIPNNAFYRIATALGGYSWDKAGKIWYRTLNDERLVYNADFKLFADITADIATTDYGQEVHDVVVKAWTDIGVLS